MIAPPEKRKVGSRTLPLTTIIYQHECPADDQMDGACLCLRVYLRDYGSGASGKISSITVAPSCMTGRICLR